MPWFGWVLLVLGIYVVVLVVLALISLHPYRIPFWISPAQLGAPQEDVIYGQADGKALRGWWVPNDRSKNVAVLAHGYMMNRCELTPEAFWLWQRGFSCLVVDLRCHGKSGGDKCLLGIAEKQDVKAAVEFAARKVPDGKVVLIGSSMGSVACTMALSERHDLAEALVLDSAFGRLTSAMTGWWSWLGGRYVGKILTPVCLVAWPMAGFNPFKVDVREYIRKLPAELPILMIHGCRDTLAQPSEARRNYDAIRGPKDQLWFDGCNHSEGRWLYPDRYREALGRFLTANGFELEEPVTPV